MLFLCVYFGKGSEGMYQKTNKELPSQITENYDIISCLKYKPEVKVYLLKSLKDEQKYILKCGKNTYVDRLENEKIILSLLNDEVFPKFVDSYIVEGECFEIRTYIEGESLFDIVEKKGPYSIKEAVQIMISVCDIINKLHSHDNCIICRDIKPQNIIMTTDGKCALVDLDTARLYKDNCDFDTVFLGTKETASPEQFGYGQSDERSDIYGMGMLFHYLLTGDFKKDRIKSEYKGAIRKVVKKCTRFAPEDRYQSVSELKSDLVSIKRFKIRKKMVYLTILFSIVFVIVGGVILVNLFHENQKETVIETVDFDSDTLELYVRKVLKKTEGEPIYLEELDKVTSIVICGDKYFDSFSQYSEYISAYWYEWDEMSPAATPVTQNDLDKFKNVDILALDNQGYTEMLDLSHLELYKLSLCKNDIEDISGLESQTEIAVLRLSGTRVKDISCLSGMSKLYELDLNNTQVEDLSSLRGLNIEILKCLDCKIYEYDVLKNFSGLIELQITTGKEEMLSWIGEFESLKFIAITDSYFTDLKEIKKLTNLEGIELAGSTRLTDLNGIHELERLNYLGISGTGITEFPDSIKDSKIRIIDMKGVYVEDATILNECVYLRQVYVSEEMVEHYASQLDDYIQIIGY